MLRPLQSRLYLRLTAVLLLTLSLFGAAVVTLHVLALGRAPIPLRRDLLRFVADEMLRDPRGAPERAGFPRALLTSDGAVVWGAALPPWVRRELPGRGPGEYCGAAGAPCFAIRDVVDAGETRRLVVYYQPTPRLFAPVTVAFLASVLLWLVASGSTGLLLLRALQRADESRRRLVAGLAHDLGTPLTSISGFAETMLHSPSGDATRDRSWAVVFREAQRMQRMVDDMLALSRLEAGRLELVPRPFDLREPLRAAAERARMAFGQPPALALPEHAAPVNADRDRIDQVVANLVDNAFRHGAGREVRVSLAAEDGHWRISVEDRGPGLSPKARARLFEPFHRGGGEGGGSGLGLAIAREIVERHGGRLALLDVPGGGCRASLTLRRGGV